VYIELFPVRVKTLAAFSGLDPWNELAPAEFTIEAHLLGPKNPVRAPRDTGGPYILGLRSELDGETHIMPESLSELWNTGKAPAEALPGLLHGIGPRLRKQDFRSYLRAKWHIWILGFYSAVALAAWLWSASQFSAASRKDDAAVIFGIVIGAIALAPGLLVFSVIRRRQLRRRRQMAEILAALGQGV